MKNQQQKKTEKSEYKKTIVWISWRTSRWHQIRNKSFCWIRQPNTQFWNWMIPFKALLEHFQKLNLMAEKLITHSRLLVLLTIIPLLIFSCTEDIIEENGRKNILNNNVVTITTVIDANNSSTRSSLIREGAQLKLIGQKTIKFGYTVKE